MKLEPKGIKGCIIIGNDSFDIDPKNTFIRERTEEYTTLWDIRISAGEGFFDGEYRCRPNLRGEGIVVPEFCLSECQGRTIRPAGKYVNPNEDVPFSIYVARHSDTHGDVIQFGKITDDIIDIQWTGTADLFWNDELGRDVPFEIACDLRIESMIAPADFVSPSRFALDKMAAFAGSNEYGKEDILGYLSDLLNEFPLTGPASAELADFIHREVTQDCECKEYILDLLYTLQVSRHTEDPEGFIENLTARGNQEIIDYLAETDLPERE